MTVWFTSPETTPRADEPSELFVRFVARNFKPPALFLDIGSGSGANARYLARKGFSVDTLDSAPEAEATFRMDISEWANLRWSQVYNCIFDINTLCHVEHPPYREIYRALRPGGKFFSIHPSDDTEADFEGKGFTRRAEGLLLAGMVGHAFENFNIRPSNYPDGNRNIASWVIEAER